MDMVGILHLASLSRYASYEASFSQTDQKSDSIVVGCCLKIL